VLVTTSYREPWTFLVDVLVECPRCSGRAVIHGAGDAPRLVCGECGYVRDSDRRTLRLGWDSVGQDGREPSFALPLWLATDCCGGNVLWALNEPHLDYLERFVASTNRDHDFPSPPGHRSLAYKLPRWMQLGSNRDELLHSIRRLRERLR
jgi:ribosomal protein S27AE